jgi:hypothetical protein
MKTIFKSIILTALLLGVGVKASDPTFEIKDLLDESGIVKQTLVFMSERDCQEKIPGGLKALMKLPKTQHQTIHPLSLYEFPDAYSEPSKETDSEQKFYPVFPDVYAIIEAKNFAEMPYLLAADVNDYVAVGIYVPDTMAGIMYVGYKSFDSGLFTQFLQMFSKNKRATTKVTLTSSYYSTLLLQVCRKIAESGFKNLSLDVVPIFLDNPTRTSSGTKYYSYERFGFSLEDACRLSKLSSAQITQEVNPRAALYPVMGESHRALIMDVRTGKTCQFVPEGFGESNSKLIHLLCDTHKKALKVLPLFQKNTMSKAVEIELNAIYAASRILAHIALGALGPNTDGLERISAIFAEDAKKEVNKK